MKRRGAAVAPSIVVWRNTLTVSQTSLIFRFGRLTLRFIPKVDIDAKLLHEVPDCGHPADRRVHVDIALPTHPCSDAQWRNSMGVRDGRISASVDKQADDVDVTRLSCAPERRCSNFVDS